MKQLNSVLLLVLLANTSIIAEGQQDSPTQERTPISTNATEKTLTGILIYEDNLLYLIEDSGATYAINPRPRRQADKSMGGGPPPGGQKGQRQQESRPTPPDMKSDYEQYHGLKAIIQGLVMDTPPEGSPFGDIDGLIFPDSIIVDGEDIL